MEGARLDKRLPACSRLTLAELWENSNSKIHMSTSSHLDLVHILNITPGNSPGAAFIRRAEGRLWIRYEQILTRVFCLVDDRKRFLKWSVFVLFVMECWLATSLVNSIYSPDYKLVVRCYFSPYVTWLWCSLQLPERETGELAMEGERKSLEVDYLQQASLYKLSSRDSPSLIKRSSSVFRIL